MDLYSKYSHFPNSNSSASSSAEKCQCTVIANLCHASFSLGHFPHLRTETKEKNNPVVQNVVRRTASPDPVVVGPRDAVQSTNWTFATMLPTGEQLPGVPFYTCIVCCLQYNNFIYCLKY